MARRVRTTRGKRSSRITLQCLVAEMLMLQGGEVCGGTNSGLRINYERWKDMLPSVTAVWRRFIITSLVEYAGSFI